MLAGGEGESSVRVFIEAPSRLQGLLLRVLEGLEAWLPSPTGDPAVLLDVGLLIGLGFKQGRRIQFTLRQE